MSFIFKLIRPHHIIKIVHILMNTHKKLVAALRSPIIMLCDGEWLELIRNLKI